MPGKSTKLEHEPCTINITGFPSESAIRLHALEPLIPQNDHFKVTIGDTFISHRSRSTVATANNDGELYVESPYINQESDLFFQQFLVVYDGE